MKTISAAAIMALCMASPALAGSSSGSSSATASGWFSVSQSDGVDYEVEGDKT